MPNGFQSIGNQPGQQKDDHKSDNLALDNRPADHDQQRGPNSGQTRQFQQNGKFEKRNTDKKKKQNQ